MVARLAALSAVRQKVDAWLGTLRSCYDDKFAASIAIWRGSDNTFFAEERKKAGSLIAACNNACREIDQFDKDELPAISSEESISSVSQVLMREEAELLDRISRTLVTKFSLYVASAANAPVRRACVTLLKKLPDATSEVGCYWWCN
jgi:hypothetical protein